MEIYQAVILGVLQGVTEFLPVSSSGHLVLGQIFFGITESPLAFNISVHMGTLGAVVVVYFSDIRGMVVSVRSCLADIVRKQPIPFESDANLRLAVFILAGSVPTAFIGMGLKKFEEILFTSGLVVGAMLLVTGTILWISRGFYRTEATGTPLDFKRSLIIGVSQGMAVIPGISRAGTTIACGMFCGLDRQTAARFSFLLSIPAILGAEFISILESLDQGIQFDAAVIYGTLVAFVSGFIALKLLIKLVHAGKFHLFAPYCWLIGILVLLSTIV
ncbi:MAG: undecaprenyl-diphosphate phosphatase [Desulfotignum sp.]|nr:undecaprenyl-diphosphate phosphatase [Desulfotignum sp.]